MKYPENSATAAEYLKKAIPFMVANQIPANPINYTLWYNYVAENNPQLKQALDNIVSTEGGLSSEKSEELFFHYIIGEHMEDNQRSLESITQVASHILSRLSQSINGSVNFDQQLDSSLDQLKQAVSLDEITDIVDQVVNTTEDIRSANSKFQKNIEQANTEIQSLQKKLKDAEAHAYVDQLTQLYNRHAFDRQLEQLLKTEGVAKNVCLILLDLDHFKTFNDDYGHVIGDRVLQRLGELIQNHCPDNAIGARYGGEEFAILISNATIEQAQATAEDLRQRIQKLRVKLRNSEKILDNISASFGVARFLLGESAECFIDRTDKALYKAKNGGRNRVEISL